MEKLVINVPDQKSTLVKQILQGLGVTIQETSPDDTRNNYREKLTKVSVWSNEDIHAIEDARKAFNNLNSEEW